jgi:hypothetical protein
MTSKPDFFQNRVIPAPPRIRDSKITPVCVEKNITAVHDFFQGDY